MIQLFDGIVTILTTSHVIAEIHGLQHLTGENRRDFWLFSMQWLASKRLDERLIRLLELRSSGRAPAAVCEIGPTDTGLFEIAFREGAILLTDDKKTLGRHCWEQGIDCQVVEDLLQAANNVT